MEKFITYLPLKHRKQTKLKSLGAHSLNKSLLLGLLALSTLSSQVLAEADPWKHEFSLGLDVARYRYKEKFLENNKDAFMKLESNQFGASGKYRLSFSSFFIETSALVNYGHSRYSSDIVEAYHPCAARPNLLSVFNLNIGASCPIHSITLYPYIGIGLRYKSDDGTRLNDAQDDRSLHLKRVNILPFYLGGLEVLYKIDDKWSLKVGGEIKKPFSGRLYCYDRNQSPSPTLYEQKGWGASVKGMIYHHFEKVRIGVGVSWDWWRIKRSKDEYGHHRKRTDLGGVLWGYGPSHEPYNFTNMGLVHLEISW